MSSLLSMIMVIVMAFSAIGGMTANIEEPVSFEAKISVDGDALMALAGAEGEAAADETMQTVKAIVDILNVLTIKGVADKGTAELDVLAGEDVMLNIGAKNTEEGTTVASSLIGNMTIFTSTQVREQMMASLAQSTSGVDVEAMTAQLQSLDKEQMKKDCEEWAESLKKELEEKKGETETGEFTADGMAFTAKTPVNVTYTELMELILNRAKDLLTKESFQPLLQSAAGQDTDIAAEIDKAIEDLKKKPDEEKPKLEMAIYTDDAEGEYCVCDVILTTAATEEKAASEEKVYIGSGTVNGLQRSHSSFTQDDSAMDMTAVAREDGSVDMEATITAGGTHAEITSNSDPAGNMDMVCTIKTEDGDVIIHAKTEAAEGERIGFTMDMYFGSTEKALLTITGSAGKGGEAVTVYEGESITAIPIEKLMDTQDTTTSGQLGMSLMANMLKSVSVLSKNLPEDTAAWVNAQVKALMNPGASDAPAGNE